MTQPYYPPYQEVIYYQDPSPVFISSTRAVILNQTFVLQNIVSVGMVEVRKNYAAEIAITLIGLLFGGLGWRGISTALSSDARLGATVFLLVGIAIITVGVALMFTKKPKFALLLGNSGGSIETLSSYDPAYISNIVAAINTALTHS